MPSQPELSIVVPAYAEARLIVSSLRALADHLSRRPGGPVEVIVVVADSGDGTLGLARQCAPLFQRCRVIDAGPRAGKGRDVRLGMLAATGRYRLFMDADLATPLHHLEELDAYMAENAAVVIGARNLWRTHKNMQRRLVATVGNLLIRALLHSGLRDTQCGFKMFRADVCTAVFEPANIDGWGFDLEVLVSARRRGYEIAAVTIDDWHDPKAAVQGLVADSVWRAATEVLGVVFRLRKERRRDAQTGSSERASATEPGRSAA